MAFDISTARPVSSGGFDISSAQPAIDPNIMANAQAKNPQFIPDPGVGINTFVEPALSLVSGAIAEPVAGLAGLASAPFVGADKAADIVGETREGMTFQPRSAQGKAGQRALGEFVAGGIDAASEALAPIQQASSEVGGGPLFSGDIAFNLTGSPELATLAETTPTLVAELFGVHALRSIKPGTRLLKPDGNPTKLLENRLDKQGLVFNGLTPEARSSIPEFAPKGLIPSSGDAASSVNEAVKQQIKSGARDNSLATLKVVGDNVVPDKAGLEAVRQGFDDGFVQAVKTASPESKSAMSKMLDITQKVGKNRRAALDSRPTDIVGQALSKRIAFIRNQANDAGKELNEIANTKLRGQPLDAQPVVTRLQESLSDLDVELIDGANGVPQPVFKGSLISKDRAAQKAIKDAIDLMSEGGAPDALRFHKLKRQLDNIIDFKKKSAGGLSDAGRNVLKGLRASLNDSIREVNPDYARVNDVLSSSLTALDDFQKVAGTSIDIFGEGSAKAIGQDMRGLMSNRKSRVRLENSVNALDKVASDLGATFGDDIKDLALFANSIEDRFGAVAQTSFKGEIESAINRAGQQGAKATALQAGVERVAKGAEKLRGVNDLNAFRAMRDILRTQEQ